MNYTEHKITLDIHKTVSQVSLSVKKGDTGRRLLIHLAERGYPYHISEDCYAVFTAKKPDGKVVFNECSIVDCVIIYEFTEQTVAAVGLADCEIILYGADGKQLTSASFNIVVEDTIYDTETEIESTSEYNALAALIAKLQALHTGGPLAPAIVNAVEGELLSLQDASNYALEGLRIFGKSTQDGTPTPDSPVEIENLGACGEITSFVAGQNLLDAYAITAPNTNTAIQISNQGNVIKFYATGQTATYARAELAMNHLIGRKFYVAYDKKTNYGTSVDGYLQIRYSLDGVLKYIENIPLLAGASEIPAEAYDVRLVIYFKNASVAIEAGSYVQYEGLRISLADGSAWEPYQKIQQITVSTPGGLPGIPVISDGNYTDSDGQQWICDEVDLGRGVYARRIYTEVVTAEKIIRVDNEFASTGGAVAYFTLANKHSSNDNIRLVMCDKMPGISYNARGNPVDVYRCYAPGSDISVVCFRYPVSEGEKTIEEARLDFVGATVSYVLATPIETDLPEEELIAYAALHTNKPNTTIYNDAGAYMVAEYVADTKTYIDRRPGGASGSAASIGEVTLRANAWVGNDSPYSQVVGIDGVTEYSQVDLTPSVEQLSVFYYKDLAFVTENDGGVVTVYAIGQKPENDYTIQVTITEVNV